MESISTVAAKPARIVERRMPVPVSMNCSPSTARAEATPSRFGGRRLTDTPGHVLAAERPDIFYYRHRYTDRIFRDRLSI